MFGRGLKVQAHYTWFTRYFQLSERGQLYGIILGIDIYNLTQGQVPHVTSLFRSGDVITMGPREHSEKCKCLKPNELLFQDSNIQFKQLFDRFISATTYTNWCASSSHPAPLQSVRIISTHQCRRAKTRTADFFVTIFAYSVNISNVIFFTFLLTRETHCTHQHMFMDIYIYIWIKKKLVGLERGALSLVSTNWEATW
jgi:hypothetical protein